MMASMNIPAVLQPNSSIPGITVYTTGNYSYDGKFRSRLVEWEDYTVGIYLAVVCCLAVALNSVVIYVCFKNWNVLVTSDYYILNLACSDVLLPLSGFPLAITASFKHTWIFGDIGCTLYGFLGFFFGLVSITTLTSMGFTRYVAICHPHKDISSIRITRIVLAGSYMYALLWSLIPLTGWGGYSVEAYGTSCTLQWDQNRSFITLMSLFCIVTPSIVMVMTYGLILLKCRESHRNMTQWRSGRGVSRKKLSRQEGRLIRMTFAMCWGFLVSWMPYAVVSMWTAYGDPSILPTRMTVLAVLLAKSSTVVNPIIYFMLSRKFRPLLSESLSWTKRGRLRSSGSSNRSQPASSALLEKYGERTSSNVSSNSDSLNSVNVVRFVVGKQGETPDVHL